MYFTARLPLNAVKSNLMHSHFHWIHQLQSYLGLQQGVLAGLINCEWQEIVVSSQR
jgi:hypothetical protein